MTDLIGALAPSLWDIDLDNFTVNLKEFPFGFWKNLGEAGSKCAHLTRAPLLPSTWQHLATVYLVKGVHATTAIEGNTLTELEVMAIYKKELTLPPSRLYLAKEVENVIKAMNEAWARPVTGPLSADEVCSMNARVLADLQVADHVLPGKYRLAPVGVGRYACPPAADVPRYMQSFIKWYNSFPESGSGLDIVGWSIIKAVAAHLYFVLIHPFGDGNGRTARLIEWRTLDRAGIASVATHVLSNHYNLTRTRYYEMLDRASIGRDMTSFFCYAVEGLVDQLATQLDYIYGQYDNLVYLDIVRQKTPGVSKEVVERRQELALAISQAPAPGVPTGAIAGLNATLAKRYADASAKTLSRDLHALEKAELIKNAKDGWVALTDPMFWRHRRELPKPKA